MAYAFVQDIASSWEVYERVARGLTEPTPEGLLFHLAGPTDEGFRIIDVWETEQAFCRFRSERLQPAIAALGAPSRPEPTFRDLHAAHLVIGSLTAQRETSNHPPTTHPPQTEEHKP